MVIHFYCIHQSYKKRTIAIRDWSSGNLLEEANDVSYIALDKESLFSSMHGTFISPNGIKWRH